MKFPVLAIVLLACAVPAASAPIPRGGEARALYQSALDHLSMATFDSRRFAIDELEQATLLAPEDAEVQLTLARTYLQAGYLKSARARFELVAHLLPTDPESRYGIGLAWRRDWLKYVDPLSLTRAVDNFSQVARLDPQRVDAWLMVSALQIEQGREDVAAAAAERALEARPNLPEAQLAVASTAYRRGDLSRAESLFVLAMPHLRREVRARFEDISPIASERDTAALHALGLMDRIEFERRFWKDNDPDPATPENEAQLAYWARVAQAFFLYYNQRLRQWDERGEVYVRYGPPEKVVYNPVGRGNGVVHGGDLSFISDFPANILVWDYPSLGMEVVLEDRLLSERYMLPINMTEDPDPRPDPDVLAARDDALATHELRGVFPRFPPRSHPLPVNGAIARFEGAAGPRLLAAASVPGTPADSLWATWVVLDSTRVEVARRTGTFSPSACNPTTLRSADVALELEPGRYEVAVSVRSRAGGRGVFRDDVTLVPNPDSLSLSDIAIACGAPEVTAQSPRPAPNPEATVGPDQPLSAYFEIYHLRPDAEGLAHFGFDYTVRSAERDPRLWIQRMFSPRPQVPSLNVSHEEQNPGELRRQLVSVPVQTLPPGRYWLEVRVTDTRTGIEARRRAQFRKLAPVPAPSPAGLPGHSGN